MTANAIGELVVQVIQPVLATTDSEPALLDKSSRDSFKIRING